MVTGGLKFWYTTEKARKHFGFCPRFSLQDIVRQYYENKAGD